MKKSKSGREEEGKTMCGIAGIMSYDKDFRSTREETVTILKRMSQAQKHRGPDADGIYIGGHIALAHVRLSIIDLLQGKQPMRAVVGAEKGVISYNGEIYNMMECKRYLEKMGVGFETNSDTEVLLKGLLVEGISFLQRVNGIFSFAFWNLQKRKLILARDPAGVKPLFYQKKGKTILFASEIKALLVYPGNQSRLNRKGLCEILALGPAKSYGEGIFQGIHEVKPGTILELSEREEKEISYFQLKALPHTETYEETVAHTKELLLGAIRRQMLSDVPICTFLSGGLDSSFVTAVVARELAKQGHKLTTYSFDFEDNDRNFIPNAFQPTQDAYYARKMVEHLHTDHRVLLCSAKELVANLRPSMWARDYPGMADVEASLLYFCREVAKEAKVALTGECADEIFGGYPWFWREDMLQADTFPWSKDVEARTMLLRDEIKKELPIGLYAKNMYEKTLSEVPILEGESPKEKRRREVMYLNIKWFMQTLLDRMDRTSMYSGLEARVPFADKEVMQYLFNCPWSMKAKNGEIKGILRAVAKDYLPEEVLYRKKSPYPKTYDPVYESMVKRQMEHLLLEGKNPLFRIYDPEKIREFMKGKTNYDKPFYGQLMAGPQYLAYLLEMAWWFTDYQITFV